MPLNKEFKHQTYVLTIHLQICEMAIHLTTCKQITDIKLNC